MKNYAANVDANYEPSPQEPVKQSIFEQYEYVIIESIVTSFGLDFLVKDQHGGDVDTIHNVRKIGSDEKMTYKNADNEIAYMDRGDYNSRDYHSDPNYRNRIREVNEMKENGLLKDAYTGQTIGKNQKSDLDHVISAKFIHEDRGRILTGLKGEDLANTSDNLMPTNPHTNRSKNADSMNDFIDKHGDEYSQEQKDTMKEIDKKSQKVYEATLAKKYYISSKFAKDLTKTSLKLGLKMGIRQVLGLVFMEIWLEVKKEFQKTDQDGKFDLGIFLANLGKAIKRGYENAKSKYKELFERFINGLLAGVLASITTSLCNIFFTTAKNVVRIIRQVYPSLIEATKVLLINPENYNFGDRMKATLKVLSIGASVVFGVVVDEAISKTPIGTMGILGDTVKVFCSSLVTGMMSCTLLYYLDNDPLIHKIVQTLNQVHTIEGEIDYYQRQADYFEHYAAKLMCIDLDKFHQETGAFKDLALVIDEIGTEEELNGKLRKIIQQIGIRIPWENYHDFDSFMNDKDSPILFE